MIREYRKSLLNNILKYHRFPRDFQYMNMYLLDGASQDLSGVFWFVVDFFENVRRTGGKIYVHCHQGELRNIRYHNLIDTMSRCVTVDSNGNLLYDVDN